MSFEKQNFVSIIIPVLNEERYIQECFNKICVQDYPKHLMEIIVADGISTDQTLAIIKKHNFGGIPIKVIPNPEKGRAQGLNIAINAARGNIIVRLDTRSTIEPSYITKCVKTLCETNADNVGGLQIPIGHYKNQIAIGYALQSWFGIGSAKLIRFKKSGYVDSVYLGCFKREVFEKVGFFDSKSAIISEDSDLNERIRKAGGKVYQNIDIVTHYYPRETFKELWNLSKRYGGARAANLLKTRKLPTFKQALSPLFILILIILFALSFMHRAFLLLLLLILIFYLTVNFIVSARVSIQQKKPTLFFRLAFIFPSMHIPWGLGFWKRLLIPPRKGSYWSN